ncbi:Uu.00g075650.m01.CDS01 [Anthostomella pinea]|uniref:Uu.00g075650.m01.CDS01 n=1 Tax=Anthostomella pinea TaxID=933095 RepID=A0AAI8VWL5_9PEZI|nr:Uu.00g075650.m01.CDS01 [Anthostomella pinea]
MPAFCCLDKAVLSRPRVFDAEPPNHGRQAWAQVVSAFLICFCTLGLGNSFGVFQGYFAQSLLLSHSPSAISWIGTVQGFFLSIVGILSGALYDKGYIRSLVYTGAALSVAGLVATSFSSEYTSIFVSFGFIVGLGCGAIYIPALAILGAYFTTRLPVANAIATTGSSMGGVLYPILFRSLIDSVGFPWTCRIFAFINGALLLVSCLLIRPRRAEPVVEEELKPTKSTLHQFLHLFKALADLKFLAFSLCLFLLMMGIDVPFFYLSTIAQKKLGLSPQIGDYLLSGLNASSLFGRLVLGLLADYTDSLHVWQFSTLGTTTLLFSFGTISSLATIIVFAVFYGVFTGGLMTLVSPVLRIISPDPRTFGSNLGLAEGFMGLGILVGSPVAGAISETAGGFLAVGIFFGSLYVVVFVVIGIFIWKNQWKTANEDVPSDGAFVTVASMVPGHLPTVASMVTAHLPQTATQSD